MHYKKKSKSLFLKHTMQQQLDSIKFEKEEEINLLKETSVRIDSNPFSFLRKNGKEGLSIIKGMISTITLFGFVNFFLVVFSVYKYFTSESQAVKISYLLILILTCAAFFAIAYIKSYKNSIAKAINLAYDKLNFLLKKFCNILIEKVATLFQQKKENLKSKNLKTLINVQEISTEIFTKLPKFVSKGIIILLNRIPIIDLVVEFKNDIQEGKKIEASEKLFIKIDTQIREDLLSNASKKWIYWLLPLNIIVVYTIIFLKFT